MRHDAEDPLVDVEPLDVGNRLQSGVGIVCHDKPVITPAHRQHGRLATLCRLPEMFIVSVPFLFDVVVHGLESVARTQRRGLQIAVKVE